MSSTDAAGPAGTLSTTPAIEKIFDAQPRTIDGFTVGRVLPSPTRRLVGPFIFFEHMGPAQFVSGQALDVRPHPHIHLATITYLFEGEITHRDSLGSAQTIRPGAIHWMMAGRGIVHSERTPPELRGAQSRLHGLQLWVALPRAAEDSEPDFRHYSADVLPRLQRQGVRLSILAGSAYGATSPVPTHSPLLYVEAILDPGARLELPSAEERAAYIVEGAIRCGAERASARQMLIFAPSGNAVLRAEMATRLVLVGGEPLDGPRYVFWNFVSSSPDRIVQAMRDWREGLFPRVPGDEEEFMPLPSGG